MQAHYLNIMQFFLRGCCHKWGFKAMEHWGEFVCMTQKELIRRRHKKTTIKQGLESRVVE